MKYVKEDAQLFLYGYNAVIVDSIIEAKILNPCVYYHLGVYMSPTFIQINDNFFLTNEVTVAKPLMQIQSHTCRLEVACQCHHI